MPFILSEYLIFVNYVPLFRSICPYTSRRWCSEMKHDRAVLDRRNVPFVMVSRAVIEDETIKASDKSVYSVLCMYADNNTADCWPSRDTLLKKAGISDRTLRNSLKTLEERGYIEVIKRYADNGRQLSNLYVLLDVPGKDTQ